jgi:hypothetical protein
MANRLSIALGMILISSTPAYAPFMVQTYTEFAKALGLSLAEVKRARGLSAVEAALAKRTSAAWVYLGPCNGESSKLKSDLGGAAVTFSVVNLAKPSNPLGAAMLEMIAIMLRENLGRTPSGDMCRFALETAA